MQRIKDKTTSIAGRKVYANCEVDLAATSYVVQEGVDFGDLMDVCVCVCVCVCVVCACHVRVRVCHVEVCIDHQILILLFCPVCIILL